MHNIEAQKDELKAERNQLIQENARLREQVRIGASHVGNLLDAIANYFGADGLPDDLLLFWGEVEDWDALADTESELAAELEQVRVLRGACIETERRMGDPYLDPSYWEVCPERGLLNAAIAATEPD